VRRHRDVAVCDACGRLLLGYGDDADWRKATDELTRNRVPFETDLVGSLHVVAKERRSRT
jgi:hypothetical protein